MGIIALKRIIPVVLAAALLAALFAGCQTVDNDRTADIPPFASFRDIPGVTADDIEEIRELRAQTDHFVYGALPGIEAFYTGDGEVAGFAALLCDWLTELFEIPFVPAIIEWADLIPGLEVGEIDFNGDLPKTSGRTNNGYFMTDAIAAHMVKYFKVAGSPVIQEISNERPPRIIIREGSAAFYSVMPLIELEDYEIIHASDTAAIYEMLISGEADAFLEDDSLIAGFDGYSGMETVTFLPLVSTLLSLATCNPELETVISIFQKALDNGAPQYLNELHKAGISEYNRSRLLRGLTAEEKAYIHNNPAIPFAAEYDNYPSCFYNIHEKEWQGAAIDILAEVSDLTGLEFRIVNRENTTWESIFNMLETGEASIISELIHTEDREGFFLWPGRAVLTDTYALISKQDTPGFSLFGIQNARVGVNKGTAFAETFKKLFPGHIHLIEYENMELAFHALSTGEVDLVMASSTRLLRLTNFDELVGFKLNVVFDQHFTSTFGFNIDEPVLCSIVNKSLELIDISGIAGQWTQKSFDYRIKLEQERLPWIVSATAMLIVLMFLFILSLRTRSERNRLEIAVENRTAELEEAQLGLHAAVRKAESANSAKTSFLANMSHDMRTPLNAILGLSGLSLGDEGLSDEVYSNLEKIEGAGITLLSIVSDILDISKIETGKIELIPSAYDTPELISDAVTQSILHIEEKPIRFILNIGENFPLKLCGDELRIKQILNNLLSNAFKYTKQGEVELTVGCVTDEDVVWLTADVRDTGIGIRPGDIPGLFTDYAQMDMAANRKIIGTGLGLPIAKRLAEMMDGSISVQSEYGKGSIFTVRLRQKYVTDATVSAEVAERLRNFNYSGHRHHKVADLPRISLPYARVLVVDDMDTNLQVARGLMKRYDIQVDCLTNGCEAVETVRDGSIHYNAIFMDHMMPDMDGIEATRLIREIDTDYAKNVPIIAFTANALVGNEELFLENGFQAFISKPIEIARLDAVVRDWVRDKSINDVLWKTDNRDTPVSGPHFPILKYNIEGIDFKKGIERFCGDESDYIDVLRSYVRNTSGFLEKVRVADKDHLRDYAVVVHGIKGASFGICADEIAGQAEALEMAAKAGEYDYVETHNTAFVEKTGRLLSCVGEMLEKLYTDRPGEKRDKPDNETLNKLREACLEHDMERVDATVAELEAFEYGSGGELVTWLRENAELMNYSQIAERLATQD